MRGRLSEVLTSHVCTVVKYSTTVQFGTVMVLSPRWAVHVTIRLRASARGLPKVLMHTHCERLTFVWEQSGFSYEAFGSLRAVREPFEEPR